MAEDELPAKTVMGFEYIRAKAERYLAIGPGEYRKRDHFGQPEEDVPAEMLARIETGMKQVLEGRGVSQDKPLEGLQIDGFYALLRVLHFQLGSQMICENTDEYFLDEMKVQHALLRNMHLVLYNRVDK